MLVALRISDALICQPAIQLGQARYPRLGPEQLIAQIADLVFDLSLLPTRCGRAGNWLNQMM